MDYLQAFGETEKETSDRVDRVIALTERLEKIGRASDRIKYDEQLLLEIPDVLKLLGAAKDIVIAELKTI